MKGEDSTNERQSLSRVKEVCRSLKSAVTGGHDKRGQTLQNCVHRETRVFFSFSKYARFRDSFQSQKSHEHSNDLVFHRRRSQSRSPLSSARSSALAFILVMNA